ncbi:Uncharacterised protein [Providencia stuartii]|nr:Uncharacterised protein [Providencia stuartii]
MPFTLALSAMVIFDDVSFKLFTLINMIVQQGITEPKEVDNMFGSLPEGPRQAAVNRDKPKP